MPKIREPKSSLSLEDAFNQMFGEVSAEYQQSAREELRAHNHHEEMRKRQARALKSPSELLKSWIRRELGLEYQRIDFRGEVFNIWHWPKPERYHPYITADIHLSWAVEIRWRCAPKSLEELQNEVAELRRVIAAVKLDNLWGKDLSPDQAFDEDPEDPYPAPPESALLP